MTKREINGSGRLGGASKRRRTQGATTSLEDNYDDEQRAYDQEIRQQDAHLGATIRERADLSVCEDGYRPGSILRIYMKNVMSYDECCVNFGPKLNFIIGPNGSGKSTILAAICLAFAAPIKCMGKDNLTADQLIKSTKQDLEVIVDVKNFGNLPNVVFRRTLSKGSKSGTFYINGEEVSMKTVREKARELDIQIKSMTRFLPQDRVKIFTTLSPKDLLLTTMEDVGYANMRSHFDLLVDQQNHNADNEHKLKLAKDSLSNLEQRREVLDGQIALLEERERQEEQVKKLENVAVYAKGKSLQFKAEQLKTKLKSLQESYRAHRTKNQALQIELDQHQEEITRCLENLNDVESEAKSLWRKDRDLKDQERDIIGRFAAYDGELDAARKKLAYHSEKTKELQLRIKAEQLAYTQVCEELDNPAFQEKKRLTTKLLKKSLAELEEAKATKAAYDSKSRVLQGKVEERYSAFLMEQEKNNSMQMVTRANLSLVKKVQVIAPPEQYKYSLPAINNVRLRRDDPLDQHMVHATVRSAALMFVAHNSVAMNQIMKVEDQVIVKEVSMSLAEASSINVPLTPNQLQSYGFDGYVLDLLEGPEHNLAHLCITSKIHTIPFSRKGLSPEQLERVPSNVSKFISGNILYSVIQSRYGNKYKSTKSEPIDNVKIDKTSLIIYEKRPDFTRQRELEEQYKELKAKLDAITPETEKAGQVYREVGHRHNENKDKLREIRSLESKKEILGKNVSVIRTKLREHTEAQPADIEEVRSRIEEEKSSLRDSIAQKLLERVKITQKLAIVVSKAQKYTVYHAKANGLFQLVRARAEVVKNELVVTKEEFEQTKLIHEEARNKYKDFMKDHDEIGPEYKDFFEELRAQYDGDDIFEHVEAQIQALRQELTFANVDLDARAKYDEVVQQVERLRQEVDYLSSTWERQAREMQTVTDVFIPRLEEMVEKVSSRFALLLRDKKDADGRVVLRRVKPKKDNDNTSPDEPLPFSEWGIDILCSFRKQSDLCRLDGVTQSGGERSMCIGMYLLALQAVAPVAFRALDEINQALDAINEVIMNQHVAKTASEFHQQLFLLSPKLIRFEYPRGMRVLVICNGSGVNTNGESGGSYLSIRHTQKVFA